MDESPQSIVVRNDDSKSDIEIRSEPDEDNSHFCDTPKPSRNDSACTTQQINLEKPDNQAQKRKQPSQEDLVSKKHRASLAYQTSDDDSVSEDEKFYMIVLDLSKDFPIKQFLEECGVVDINDMIKNNKRQVQLTFENETDRNTAIQRLGEEGITGHIARPKLSGEDADFDDNVSCTTEVVSQSSWEPNEDIWKAADPLGLYGLNPEFIKKLDIRPPLDEWVHVTNFMCDEYDLREVMELAGHVITCYVFNINRKFAKVQYSHPLEAVQAVAILNDQLCFGSTLEVCMEKNTKNDIILPKGLDNIGIGLGLEGRPIRNVAIEYQKYSRQQNSEINPILFRKNIFNDEDNSEDEDDLDNTDDKHMNVSQFMALAKTAAFINNRSFVVRHIEDFNNIEGNSCKKDAANRCQSPGSNSVKSVAMHRPGLISGPGSGTHPVSGPHPVSGSHPVSGPAGPLSAGKVAVQLTNLPPAMTFPLLCESLSCCGQVVSLQFTTPGCANASFLHPSHAEMCMITEDYKRNKKIKEYKTKGYKVFYIIK